MSAETEKFGDGIDWGAEARRAAAESEIAPEGGELLANILEALGDKRGWLVDCGCNIGLFAPQFMRAGFFYLGLDQSAEALAIAEERYPQATFAHSFLWEEWPRAVGPMDVAVCNAVLQHNTHPEKELIVARIAEAVRPGGLFAMQESTVPVRTATQLTQREWIALGARHGFKIQKMWHKNEFGLEDGYLFVRGG